MINLKQLCTDTYMYHTKKNSNHALHEEKWS